MQPVSIFYYSSTILIQSCIDLLVKFLTIAEAGEQCFKEGAEEWLARTASGLAYRLELAPDKVTYDGSKRQPLLIDAIIEEEEKEDSDGQDLERSAASILEDLERAQEKSKQGGPDPKDSDKKLTWAAISVGFGKGVEEYIAEQTQTILQLR